MAPEPEPAKPSLQPKLWLIGTALAVGIGAGLAMAQSPPSPHSPIQSPWLFGTASLVQAGFAWALVRAGKRPKSSLLADLVSDSLRDKGIEAPPKPLLWMMAWVMFWLAGMTGTMCVALGIGGG